MNSGHLLIRTLRGDKVERVPVWAMRQAGRWDPEFRKLRGTLGFFEFSQIVELAAAASLLPRRFGVDAIILFYDITTLAIAMGLPFELRPGVGPMPSRPIRTIADVERLQSRPDTGRYGHVLALLEKVRTSLHGELPILVFAGAPFTLACYCLGVGKDIEAVRTFARAQPIVWDALLDKLAEATIVFLKELVQAGGHAYQLFDSWAGQLDAMEYEQWAHRHHNAIFSSATGVPRILFVKELPHMDTIESSAADAISLGTRHDLAAMRRMHTNMCFQGNVSDELMRDGTPDQVISATLQCLNAGGGRRHVLNLSHGMQHDVPSENFAAFVAAGRSFRP